MSVAITTHIWTKVTLPDDTTLWVWHNAGHSVLVEFDEDGSLLLPRGPWRWQVRVCSDGHDAGFAAANVDDPWAGHPNPAAPLDHELRVQVRRAIAKSYGYESWAAVTAVEDGESEGITGAADAAISVFAPVLAERDLLRRLHAEAMWHLGQAGEVLKAVREERDAAAERDARTIDVLRNERVALWNERDEAARALASIKNRDHWEKPPTLADRVELVASELDIARDQIENLRASYEQKVQDFSRETLRLSAVLARCEKNAVPIHVVGEAGLGWEDAQEHIKGGVAQADTLWAAQQEGAGGSGVGLQSEPDHSASEPGVQRVLEP